MLTIVTIIVATITSNIILFLNFMLINYYNCSKAQKLAMVKITKSTKAINKDIEVLDRQIKGLSKELKEVAGIYRKTKGR